MGHIPLTPFSQKISNAFSLNILNFFVQKHTAGYGISEKFSTTKWKGKIMQWQKEKDKMN